MKGVLEDVAVRSVGRRNADESDDVGVTYRRQEAALAQEVVPFDVVDIVLRTGPHRYRLGHVGVVRISLAEQHLLIF